MPNQTGKPNIIICNCDELTPFVLGSYGNTLVQTPNIDRLAGVQSSWKRTGISTRELTGAPSKVAGLNFAFRTARTAAAGRLKLLHPGRSARKTTCSSRSAGRGQPARSSQAG